MMPRQALSEQTPIKQRAASATPEALVVASVPLPVSRRHQIEPELQGEVLRQVEFSKASHLERLIFWNLGAAVLLFLFYLMTVRVTHVEHLVQHGQTTYALVSRSERYSDEGTTYLDVHYRYEAKGRAWEGADHLPTYTQIKAGDRVQVTYSPENPAKHEFGSVEFGRVSPAEVARRRGAWALALAIIGGALGLIFVTAERQRARAWYLLGQGVPVIARVTRRFRTKHRDEDSDGKPNIRFRYHLDYQYRSRRGVRLAGTVELPREVWLRFQTGDRFTLICHPTDARQDKPYFTFDTVRIQGAAGARLPRFDYRRPSRRAYRKRPTARFRARLRR